MNPKDEHIDLKEVRDKFYNLIEKIPGNARHKGFQLAVLARAPMEWTELWLEGIQFILVSRIAPAVVKELSRCPIPKAGKPGESRPLSLVHDVWAFINSIIHDDLSIAVEKAGLLDKDMVGYRPGMGAMDAMVPIICMLEECFVAGEMVGLLDEDEEKYFDRILHELQEAVMRAVGIPDEGYMEIKSEDMIG